MRPRRGVRSAGSERERCGDSREQPQVRKLAARPFGITSERAWVQIDDAQLLASYGPWRLGTPLGNIRWVAITARFGST